jgi:hypothetical protein
MGRIQQIRPRFAPAGEQHLLLLQALELLVVETGGSALVGWKVSGHCVSTRLAAAPFLSRTS